MAGAERATLLTSLGAALSPLLDPGLRVARRSPGEATLLTGATGLVGAYLLAELVAHTRGPIVCVVAGPSAEAARERLSVHTARFGLWCDAVDARVEVVCGDASAPDLGLGPAGHAALAARVGSIVHAGSVQPWSGPRTASAPTNVGGVASIVALACAAGGAPIHHVSSLGVFPYGYSRSRDAAEALLDDARALGVPVRVYRPGLVTGDSRDGAEADPRTQPMWALLAGGLALGMVPRMELALDAVPVDFVARAIVALALDPTQGAESFALRSPAPLPLSRFYSLLAELGYPLEPVAYARWREAVLALDDPASPLSPFVPWCRAVPPEALAGLEYTRVASPPVEDPDARALLTRAEVLCPPIDARLLRTYVDAWHAAGVLPAPSVRRAPAPAAQAPSAQAPAAPVAAAPVATLHGPLLLDEVALQRTLASPTSVARLYGLAKERQWDAGTRLDWSIPLDPTSPDDVPDEAIPVSGSPMWARLTDAERGRLRHAYQAWQLSQVLHGEQGAMVCAGRVAQLATTADARLYAATQMMDEARHVEVFSRLLREKFGQVLPVAPPLRSLLDQALTDARWDLTWLGMQVLSEGMALAAFASMRDLPCNPLVGAVSAYVMEDDARHVAFGRLALGELYTGLTEAERGEREEFVLEASHLLCERFVPSDLWAALGLPAAETARWMAESGTLVRWRSDLFRRVVPTLRGIGLWTARVRAAYAAMGVVAADEGAGGRLRKDHGGVEGAVR